MSDGVNTSEMTKREKRQINMMKNRQYAAKKKYYLSYNPRPFHTIPDKFECEMISTDEYLKIIEV